MAISPTIDPQLVREMLALKQGDHLCLIYDNDPAEQLPALLPFISQGLQAGEQCVYVADDNTLDELSAYLTAYGIDVEAERERNALLLWTREDWRQPGELDSGLKAQQVREVIRSSQAAGFSGIRFCVEMTWVLGPDIEAGRLRHWEATINDIFTPATPARIVCQYSRRRLPPQVIVAALRTHPVAILGNELYANAYYDAPLILGQHQHVDDSSDSAVPGEPDDVDWMLSQLRWVHAFEREREDRLRVEVALQEAQRAHEQVSQMYEQSELQAQELREANVIKDQFLGLVSHELRTPISIVIGNGLLLQRRADLLSDADKTQALDDIVAESLKLQRMIENLLVLARSESEPVDLEPVHLARLADEAVAGFSKRYPARSVRIEPSPEPPVALGRGVLLSEVLENLLTNAHKYSPPDQPIEVHLRHCGDEVEVCVRDFGYGLAEDETERVFDAFYRSPRSKERSSGMGLGLAVCRRVLAVQQGRIWAVGRPGGGSDFVFAVRAAEPRPVEARTVLGA